MENKSNNSIILREFGLLIGFGFPFLIGFIFPLLAGHNFRIWTIFVSLPILILGIFSPKYLNKPYRLWMKLGYALGWINSKVILGFVFCFILIPISLVMKLLGHKPLTKVNKEINSYKEDKNKVSIDLNRIF